VKEWLRALFGVGKTHEWSKWELTQGEILAFTMTKHFVQRRKCKTCGLIQERDLQPEFGIERDLQPEFGIECFEVKQDASTPVTAQGPENAN